MISRLQRSMEMLDIVHPETGESLGAPLPRAEAIAQQAWCRSTNVFVLGPDGRVLCHRRSALKERLPGAWSTHLGGHVSCDETYESNALKELKEESGIDAHPSAVLPWRTVRIDHARLWAREFVTVCDLPESALTPQPGEVDEFRWMTLDEVLSCAAAEPKGWCAGSVDFRTEYHCMRAVLGAAHALGVMAVPQGLLAWRSASLAA